MLLGITKCITKTRPHDLYHTSELFWNHPSHMNALKGHDQIKILDESSWKKSVSSKLERQMTRKYKNFKLLRKLFSTIDEWQVGVSTALGNIIFLGALLLTSAVQVTTAQDMMGSAFFVCHKDYVGQEAFFLLLLWKGTWFAQNANMGSS